MGQASWRALADHFGIMQFGFNLETLQPGAQSSVRHWHTLSDMCVGFKAGDRNAHRLVNRSALEARFIVVGTRVPGDTAFYPDDDLAWFRTEIGRVAVHKDGTPYPRG